MKGNGHPSSRSTALLEAMVAAGDHEGALQEMVRLLEGLAADVRLAMLRLNAREDEYATLQGEIDDVRRTLWQYDPDGILDDDDDGRRATLDGSEVIP